MTIWLRTGHYRARRLWSLVISVVLTILPIGAWSDCQPADSARAAAVRKNDFTRGLLWKIETPGTAPSFLFGTMHSNDPRVARLPCPVKQAFDQSTSYTMEMILNGAAIVSMAEVMFLPAEKTLQQTIGDSLYQDVLKALGSNPQLAGGLNRMKPWVIIMMLSAPREQSGLFLDLALMRDAVKSNKSTHGLESAREQFEVFDGLSLDDQITLLRDSLQSHRTMADVMEELTLAYLRGDLGALVELSEKHQPVDDRAHRRLMDRLLVQRNINMSKRMATRLKEGNAFIAVGALHLPGEQGLLRLLTDAGYRVSAVY